MCSVHGVGAVLHFVGCVTAINVVFDEKGFTVLSIHGDSALKVSVAYMHNRVYAYFLTDVTPAVPRVHMC